MSEPRITIEDVIAAGHCVRGARRWFEGHGFDFRQFRRDGATEGELLATGDALAAQVIARKRSRHG